MAEMNKVWEDFQMNQGQRHPRHRFISSNWGKYWGWIFTQVFIQGLLAHGLLDARFNLVAARIKWSPKGEKLLNANHHNSYKKYFYKLQQIAESWKDFYFFLDTLPTSIFCKKKKKLIINYPKTNTNTHLFAHIISSTILRQRQILVCIYFIIN